jgi:hypothetical protein
MTVNHEELIYEIYVVACYDIFVMDYTLFRKDSCSYGNSVAACSRIIWTAYMYETLQVKYMGSA